MFQRRGAARPQPSLVSRQRAFLGQRPQERKLSEKLEELIASCYASVRALLSEKRNELDRLAALLLEREKIEENDLVAILGARAAVAIA